MFDCSMVTQKVDYSMVTHGNIPGACVTMDHSMVTHTMGISQYEVSKTIPGASVTMDHTMVTHTMGISQYEVAKTIPGACVTMDHSMVTHRVGITKYTVAKSANRWVTHVTMVTPINKYLSSNTHLHTLGFDCRESHPCSAMLH